MTTIEWTDETWNPLRGCSVISPGCHNCYAMRQGHRFSGLGGAYEGLTKQTSAGPQWTGKVEFIGDHLDDPLRWRKPRRVFVNSMADLFHEHVSDVDITRIFAVMALASQHTFQVLTKRANRMREFMMRAGRHADVAVEVFKRFPNLRDADREAKRFRWPLPNVWLGVSVENQHYADERIPLLLQTPAAIRFISAEPLIGPVNFGPYFYETITSKEPIDWVIVGGESGPGARMFDITFARSIVKQCADAGVACFVKQLGSKPEQPSPGAWNSAHREPMKLRDHKGGDITEWPPDLRVRQFPNDARRSR